MLRLQVVDGMLPPGKAKEELEETLEVGDQAIIEGRNTVRDLRSPLSTNDLAHAVRALGDELAGGSSTTFRLVVEGPVRDLHPIVRDEIYRIAREALRNAFAHARAKQIEVEITYEDRLAPAAHSRRWRRHSRGILNRAGGAFRAAGDARAGQADRRQLNIWTAAGAGTEIDVSIPGKIAYRKKARRVVLAQEMPARKPTLWRETPTPTRHPCVVSTILAPGTNLPDWIAAL